MEKHASPITTLSNALKATSVLAFAVVFSSGCSSGSEKENYYEEYKEENPVAETPATTPAEDDGKGVGPVKTVTLGELDNAMAEKGKALFETRCVACHKLTDEKLLGPGMAGVTNRRKPEWIMNMMLNPEEMTKKDPEAKKLLAEHKTQMVSLNLSEQEARAILEFLRLNDAKQ
ncbi:MAG: cytochrome c [Hymenobacteraceae bacterium]|nr:cytochrome c [Hymenobacteraceae bacterium]MDX5394871.1 cytochrome c [Hymenobacteraceae bacterium]MDX5510906.1 cytochrome c [Hymenobacteraceae bacterium]